MSQSQLPSYASATLATAYGMLQEGEDLAADELMVIHAKQSKSDFGDESIQYANALFEHGVLLRLAGEPEFDSFMRDAAVVAMRIQGKELIRFRITSILGKQLVDSECYEEAEQWLDYSIDLAEDAGGVDGFDYAHALYKLGWAQWMNGKPKVALRTLEKAYRLLFEYNDLSMFHAAMLIAMVHKSLGSGIATFPRLSDRAPEQLDEAFQEIIDFGSRFGYAMRAHVMVEFYTCCSTFPQCTQEQRMNFANEAAYMYGQAEEWELSERYRDLAIQIARDAGLEYEILRLQCEKAVVYSTAGENDRADTLFIDVMNGFRNLDLPQELSWAMRMYARMLADMGNKPQCEALLRQALEIASVDPNAMGYGFALGDLGVWLHHQQKYDAAAELLEEALPIVLSNQYWHNRIHDHLDVRSPEHDCGCLNEEEILAYSRRALDDAPPVVAGLVERLRIDNKNNFKVSLTRGPTEAEQDELNAFFDGLLEDIIRLRKAQHAAL